MNERPQLVNGADLMPSRSSRSRPSSSTSPSPATDEGVASRSARSAASKKPRAGKKSSSPVGGPGGIIIKPTRPRHSPMGKTRPSSSSKSKSKSASKDEDDDANEDVNGDVHDEEKPSELDILRLASRTEDLNDFLWVMEDEPHASRRKMLIASDGDEIRPLMGHEPLTKYIVVALMVRFSPDCCCSCWLLRACWAGCCGSHWAGCWLLEGYPSKKTKPVCWLLPFKPPQSSNNNTNNPTPFLSLPLSPDFPIPTASPPLTLFIYFKFGKFALSKLLTLGRPTQLGVLDARGSFVGGHCQVLLGVVPDWSAHCPGSVSGRARDFAQPSVQRVPPQQAVWHFYEYSTRASLLRGVQVLPQRPSQIPRR